MKPSHFVRRGVPLPKALSREQVQRLFCPDRPCDGPGSVSGDAARGLRVSEVAQLKLEQIDWEQQAFHTVQGEGRKDRRVYLSPDAIASLKQCVEQHPGTCAQGYVFWNRKRQRQPLSIKAIQKKMERYTKAAGIPASCHSLRHTFASNLLEHGAEVVTIRDFLGHSQIASSERYAKVSNQKVKQEYLRTMQKILKQGQVALVPFDVIRSRAQYFWTLRLERVMILPQRNILVIWEETYDINAHTMRASVVVRTSRAIEPIPSKMESNARCTIVPHVTRAFSETQEYTYCPVENPYCCDGASPVGSHRRGRHQRGNTALWGEQK